MRLSSKAVRKLLTIAVVCPGGATYSFISGYLEKGIIVLVATVVVYLALSSYWKSIFQKRQLLTRLATYTVLLIAAFGWAAIAPEKDNVFAGVAFFVLTPLLFMAAISIAKSKDIDNLVRDE